MAQESRGNFTVSCGSRCSRRLKSGHLPKVPSLKRQLGGHTTNSTGGSWLFISQWLLGREQAGKSSRGEGTRPGSWMCHPLPPLWLTFVRKMHPRFTWTLGYKCQKAKAPGLPLSCLPYLWIHFFIEWFICFTNNCWIKPFLFGGKDTPTSRKILKEYPEKNRHEKKCRLASQKTLCTFAVSQLNARNNPGK